ncbi:MAG: hypothetical protein U5L72_15480 [Bacteroidales bacterium]|nr:hypothetical protein [Bacteroidales bacterium]
MGGFSDTGMDDAEGPAIRLFMNDTLFRDGGVTDKSPTLLALISDESGINATGTGIGHDIIAWIDDDMSGAVTLNSLYEGRHRKAHLGQPCLSFCHIRKGRAYRLHEGLGQPEQSHCGDAQIRG